LQSDHKDGGSLQRTVLGTQYEHPSAFILIKHTVENWDRRRNENEEKNTKIVLNAPNGCWLIRYKDDKREHVYASAEGMKMCAMVFPVSASEETLGSAVDFARACHAFKTLKDKGMA